MPHPLPLAFRAVWRREHARDPRTSATMHVHIAASRACARAMIDGDFAYVRYAATNEPGGVSRS